MKYPVRLFLGNEEVEFSTPPEILFNYSETELTNPTIVKNSYSKTITIEGTPQNNKIFGHIYNLERLQGYNGSINGVGFNPLVKTDFALYYNGSVYESGYFKLDEVRRNNNNIEYDITLYGGLGDFFYNLTYREDGNPMELSDLTYNCEKEGENFGFTINKETVYSAWTNVPHEYRWDTINFAPCYNGIPDNFAADKFLINQSGITEFGITPTISTNTHPKYSVGTSKNEHTEWETFDLRSYLQRPVVRVKEVLDACFDPDNNGGYTVNLDQDFFYNNNPYYWKAWMTLPLLTQMDVPATVQTPLTITSITQEGTYLYDIYNSLGNVSNVSFNLKVKFTPDSYTGSSVYLIRSYWADGGITLQNDFIKTYCSDSAILVQMLGYNSSGQIAAVSNMYYLTSYVADNFYFKNSTDWAKKCFNLAEPQTDVNTITMLRGKFTKKNGEYVWTDESGNIKTLKFNFPSDAEFTDLKLKIVTASREYYRKILNGGSYETYNELGTLRFWNNKVTNSSSWQRIATVRALNRVNGSVSYVPMGATGTTESFEGFYSNRVYTKKDLMTLGVTPSDFLLSYAKIFGLYFIKDVESKTIDILTRHNFYKRNEVENINDLVDKGSDITIIPNSPQYQYYDFTLEQAESEAAKSYKKTYGNDYGTATVNTGYQYEKQHKALLDGNIFKGGINVLEKNKYFQAPTNGIPCLTRNGFDYWYWRTNTGITNLSYDAQPMTGSVINPDGLVYFDNFPKPQFHTEGNAAADGSMVLLFQEFTIDTRNIGYHLTDDIQEMYTMNDGQSCWIMTRGEYDKAGNKIAIAVDYMPEYEREVYNDYNYIQYSFDLGSPLTTYVPEKYVSDWQSIYSKAWKSYISDLYDVNTRVLNCRCLLRERPNPDWLRRFYWFDNSYWRLNNIKDWNISSFGTTEMEFIKVQDIANYDNVKFSTDPIVEWHLDQYSIGNTGGTIKGYIYVSDGSIVTATDTFIVTYSDGTVEYLEPPQNYMSPVEAYGAIQIPVTLTIPANPSSLTRTITFSVEPNTYLTTYVEVEIQQEAKPRDYADEYFTIEILSAGSLYVYYAKPDVGENYVYYRKNHTNWVALTGITTFTSVTAGDIFEWKQYRPTSASQYGYVKFFDTSNFSRYKVYGNIMSLKDGDNFSSTSNFDNLTEQTGFFQQFFFRNANLVSAENLILPATVLPASVYNEMFAECTSLVNTPELPATTLAEECYKSMFRGCTSLVNVPAALPATALTRYCYGFMFKDCTSLVNAPELPATTLPNLCYSEMFEGCSRLEYIKCLATYIDTSYSGGTYRWVRNVTSSSGTFVKKAGVSWPSGSNGIPNGWTVVEIP